MQATIKGTNAHSLLADGPLRKKDFNGWDLSNHEFKNIDLSYANFRGSNLEGTKFTNCTIFHANFKGAKIDRHTFIGRTGQKPALDTPAYFDDAQIALLGLRSNKELGR